MVIYLIIVITILSFSESFCQIARNRSKFLGNIIGNSIPVDYAKYWNQVTPKNSGKWGLVEIKRDTFNWKGLDKAYEYALRNHFPFKFHNLIWGIQQPVWINHLNSKQQKSLVEMWIKLCGQRYPKASFVDVVNEPVRTTFDTLYPPYYEAIGGKGKTGWDWVIWSFKKAREYFPHAKLLLNEYDILNGKKPINVFIHIIELLKKRDLIDGIGCQAHYLEKTKLSTIKKKLNKLEKLGLPIYISEYDVDARDDSVQLAIYKRQFPLFWNDEAIKGITLWGYLQGKIWRKDAYLERLDGSKRPAFKWLINFVKENR